MKLRFLPRGDARVWEPDAVVAPGQPARYVGRRFDPATGDYPVTGNAYECDSDTANGRRLVKVCRRDGDLLPADADTAAFCGVPFDATKPSNSKKGAE